jgi:peptide/nickel transport system permease protein
VFTLTEGTPVIGYIIRRVLALIPVFFLVTIVVFVMMRLTPGDPIQVEFGLDMEISEETREAKRKELGLDRPVVVQYLSWIGRMMQGDFGRSIRAREPVLDLIKERVPATLELAILAFVVALVIAVPWGILAAIYRRSWFASLTTAITFASISTPGFFFSSMLVFFFTYKFRIFETPRYVPFMDDPITNLRNIILPVIALSHVTLAFYVRFIRSNVLDVLGQDYIRTARAKGLAEFTVVFRHALRNALIPSVTLIGLTVATLWTGAIVTERIFNWPGMGRLFFTALVNRDYPVTQALVVFSVFSVMAGTLLVDILYSVVDPRISHVRSRG